MTVLDWQPQEKLRFLRRFYGNRGLITTKPLRGKDYKQLCPIFSMKCRHNKAFNDFELGSP